MEQRHQRDVVLCVQWQRHQHLIGRMGIFAGPLQLLAAQLLRAVQNPDDLQFEDVVVGSIGHSVDLVVRIQLDPDEIADRQIIRFRQPLVDHGDRTSVIYFFLRNHPALGQFPRFVRQLVQLRRKQSQQRHVGLLVRRLPAAGHRFRNDD